MNASIADNMEIIRTIFQGAREKASKLNDLNALVQKLQSAEPRFISVGFEGASMELALKDFASGNGMNNWKAFLKLSDKHASQVFVGLGWAIAQEKKADTEFIHSLNPGMCFRIWDGCGYFDGVFRQRQVIRNMTIPGYIPAENLRSYYQGLGRSLWYTSRGNEQKIPEMIRPFPEKHHGDLWRGIGIASTYAGGCDEEDLKILVSASGMYGAQLAIGAALVARSRIQSGSITTDTENNCRVFCGIRVAEAKLLAEESENVEDYSFDSFLAQLESKLRMQQVTADNNFSKTH